MSIQFAPTVCQICGKGRTSANHAKCSKIKQKNLKEHNESKALKVFSSSQSKNFTNKFVAIDRLHNTNLSTLEN